ncbi:FKBP-type peptidyl-prolyl cis-trans isomerase [Pedobacter deserti]|uniref:FKBP-type peptidyl-prolyl cis-trans isomerase n=1 Tax=Pedobacter deserti TaxID=2817382 RepID=UPI00210B0DC3|nr:FKBP-type peptidyl-prolyl cis-trans isomerase [Pedobacter sp. SYSU D00382]
MKKYLLAAICLVSLSAVAQKIVKKTQGSTKIVVKPFALKTTNDSISYAIGMMTTKSYLKQGIKSIAPTSLNQAVKDVLANTKTRMTEDEAEVIVLKITNPKAVSQVQSGLKFLAQNRMKPGVNTTSSGLQYEVIREGNGVKPLITDTVEVNYFGQLTDGSEFDSSYKRGESTSFPLGGVIKGWTEGLQLMSEGSKYRLYIPHKLAYGTSDRGPKIPGGSVLIFEIELLKVIRQKV